MIKWQDYVVYDGQEPVALIRRHSETYASFLGGSEKVFGLLKAAVPVTQEQTVEVLKRAGYSLFPGSLPWVPEPVQGFGRRYIPKFWGPPGSCSD